MQELTCKSKNLEAELEKTSKKLMEVTAIAADEAEKCKSAKEVIKSLAAQVRVFYLWLDFVRKFLLYFITVVKSFSISFHHIHSHFY